jgi:hypothetical protein
MPENSFERSSKRVLDPIDRVSEVLFGLIMVLTFTGSLSVAEAGRESIRTMLIGALGYRRLQELPEPRHHGVGNY